MIVCVFINDGCMTVNLEFIISLLHNAGFVCYERFDAVGLVTERASGL